MKIVFSIEKLFKVLYNIFNNRWDMLAEKLSSVINESKQRAVLLKNEFVKLIENSLILPFNIPSKNMAIMNTADGLKYPEWFKILIDNRSSHQIVIQNIDRLSKPDQHKFYELIKYRTISNISLPSDCGVIVSYTNIDQVDEIIKTICKQM